jgi:hypothetical protein
VVVMLVVSLAVTTLTGALGNIFNLRGMSLQQGVARLVALLDRGITSEQAKAIAGHLLRDPLVGRPMIFSGKLRLGDTIHREELTKLILDFASNGDATKAAKADADHSGTAVDALQTRLLASLQGNGIKDPQAILAMARQAALQLEQASPELSAAVRQNMALLNVAQSEFLGKMNAWFDQTIDRVSDLFTMRTRFVAALSALIIALFLQLDAISLLNRVHSDPAARAALVKMAVDNPARLDPGVKGEAPPNNFPAAMAAIQQNPDLKKLAGQDLIEFPISGSGWFENMSNAKPSWLVHLLGILLSALLLSLGAPFWYGTLQNLLKLRSAVGVRDDAERKERQTAQGASPSSGDPIPPEFAGGERGDPEAVG